MQNLADVTAELKKLGGSLSEVSDRLNYIEEKLDTISELVSSKAIEIDGLAACPQGFLKPSDAAHHMKIDLSTLYRRIRSGEYKMNVELKDISPEGSQRPTYRVNARAILARS